MQRASKIGSTWTGLAVLGTALAVRFLYFATTHSPSFRDPLIDGDYYDYLGWRLATGEGFEPGPFWQPPLYPLVLGALYRTFGHDLLWPRILQAGLDAASAWLAMRVTVTLTGNWKWGLASGLVIALHGPMVFYSGEILPTSAAAFLGMLACYLAVAVDMTDSAWKRSLACGTCVGAAALLVAPVLIMIVPIAWVLREQRLRASALALVACTSIVACATLANWTRANELVLISANGGVNLYIGNAPDSDRLVAIRPGAQWEELVAEPARAGIESASGQDAFFVERAATACVSDALGCIQRLLGKTRQLLSSRELPRNESFDVIKRDAWLLRLLTPSFGSAVMPSVLLLPFAFAGMVVALRRGRRTDRLVALITLSLAAVLILFFVTGRYRIQLVPELAVLAALGAQALVHDNARHRTLAALTAIIALVFAVLPLHAAVDEVPFEAEMYYVIGGRRARLGDDAGAARAWQKALALKPGYLEAGFNLGLTFERLDRPNAAARAYRKVLAAHPDHQATAERLFQLVAPSPDGN